MRSIHYMFLMIASIALASLRPAGAVQCAVTDDNYYKGWGDHCYHRTANGFFKQCDQLKCASNEPVTKQAPDNGTLKNQTLKVTPPKNASPLQHDKLYKVDMVCTHLKSFLTPTSDLLDKKTVLTTHLVALVNTSLVSAAVPAASDSSVLLLVPVFAVSGDSSNVAFFDNTDQTCSRSFLVSGRDQPNIVASLSVATQNTPTQFANVLYAALNLINPLTPFLGGLGAILKTDLPIATSTQTPFSNLIKQLDSASSTLATRRLQISGEPNPADRVTTIETPWTSIKISVSEFSNIRDSADESLISTFEKAFDALSIAVAKPPSGMTLRQICSQIGRGLQFDRNLSLEDAAYALAHIAYISGLKKDNIIDCLGSEYGPVAINLPYWKRTQQLARISVWEFPPDDPSGPNQPQYDTSVTIYQELVLALNSFAKAYPKGLQPGDTPDKYKDEAKILAKYFETSSIAIDVTGNTDATPAAGVGFVPNGVAKPPLEILSQLISKGYTFFGCPSSDALGTAGTGQGAAVAILGFKSKSPDKFQATEDGSLVLRLWVDAPLRADSTPIRRIKISSEAKAINAILMANNYRCAPDGLVSKTQAGTDAHP